MKLKINNWEFDSKNIKKHCVSCGGKFNENTTQSIQRYYDYGNYCRSCGGRIINMARLRVLVGGTDMRIKNYPTKKETLSLNFLRRLNQSHKENLIKEIKLCPCYTDIDSIGRFMKLINYSNDV